MKRGCARVYAKFDAAEDCCNPPLLVWSAVLRRWIDDLASAMRCGALSEDGIILATPPHKKSVSAKDMLIACNQINDGITAKAICDRVREASNDVFPHGRRWILDRAAAASRETEIV